MQPAETPDEQAITFPAGMQVFERGWLSANGVLFEDDAGATLVDTGYKIHADQTWALVQYAVDRMANPELRRIVNTHLHSDHCGGNAMLAKLHVCDVVIPEGIARAVRDWDLKTLSFELTGQKCDRFKYTDTLADGDTLTMGGLEWVAVGSPGHDADSLMFHCPREGLLISGDALWEDGCGAIFPSADPALLDRDFVAAFATLDQIERLDVGIVVPGHGRPFTEVAEAIDRARSRLRRLESHRDKNARHVAKVLLKFRLLDDRKLSWTLVEKMFREVPILQWANRDIDLAPDAFARETIRDLVKVGAARYDTDLLMDA